MKKYNVVFATSYVVDADDDADAEERAMEQFKEDLGTESKMQLGLFGCHVEEKEEE